MHYEQSIKDNVKNLRLQGYSLGYIHKETKIAKSTISLWVKDILLSSDQLKVLKEENQKALQKGRIESQKIKKEVRTKTINNLLQKGKREIAELNQRERFLIGVALYWAEGFKSLHEHRLGFCNSDPEMIKLYIRWLKETLRVDTKNITLRLTLNISYKEKTKVLENYWSRQTNIPISQFTKAFYQKTSWKKEYTKGNYYGVLRVHVQGSVNQLWLMRGWIEGLKHQI